jgi:hypothetical protein
LTLSLYVLQLVPPVFVSVRALPLHFFLWFSPPASPARLWICAFCFVFFSSFVLCLPLLLRPFFGFYKAREGLVSRPPEMAGIVEARDRGFRNGIVGIMPVICWIFPFPCWTGFLRAKRRR